jgi:hypothetical protein
MVRGFDEERWHTHLTARLPRTLSVAEPRHVTRRGNRRQRTFLSTECSESEFEALLRQERAGRPVRDDERRTCYISSSFLVVCEAEG